jgi:thiosulfate reductase cytochrome b subunit
MPLAFKDYAWASWLYQLMGGYPTAGYIHRICAGVTFLACFIHFAQLSYMVLVQKKFKDILWGPDSIIPQPRDLLDALGEIIWLMGFGPRPKFERYIWWEKLEYLSLIWGTLVMGLTGFMLWFPATFSVFLPGWFIDLALIFHRYEAILAAVFVFTIHFIHTHLLPEKLPVDEAMFTGKITKEDMLHERTLYYKRLENEGRLGEIKVPPPHPMFSFLSKMFAVPLLLIGLILTGLMVSSLILEFI